MPPSPDTAPGLAQHYRLPALLQDIRLLDLVEISGTTQAASRAAGLSQPTVSRRVRLLAGDFELAPNHRPRLGFGSSPAMRLLRLGCRAHRLAASVARLGADLLLQPLLAECRWRAGWSCCPWAHGHSNWRSLRGRRTPPAGRPPCCCHQGPQPRVCSGPWRSEGSASAPPATAATPPPTGCGAWNAAVWRCPCPSWSRPPGGRSTGCWPTRRSD